MTKLLTDAAIRSLRPRAKAYKLSDCHGLFIHVYPNGQRYWRWKYRFAGMQKQMSFGVYPLVSLAEAREKREVNRKILASGVDPSEKKKQDRAIVMNTFAALADELYQKKVREGKSKRTLEKFLWVKKIVQPHFGSKPITDITPKDVLDVLKKYESAGYRYTPVRIRTNVGQVFRYAIQTARAVNDPTSALRGALAIIPTTHQPAILDPAEFGALLRAVDAYPAAPIRAAMQLLALCFQRPGETRGARWEEFDFLNAVRNIPATRMKMKRPHRVSLPRQAVVILKKLRDHTGDTEFLFPSQRGQGRPISENTINSALRRMGYAKNEVVGHGFRASASTLLNESGEFRMEVIEAALSHLDPNEVRRAYNRAEFWKERVRMAQWWADYCDHLKTLSPKEAMAFQAA